MASAAAPSPNSNLGWITNLFSRILQRIEQIWVAAQSLARDQHKLLEIQSQNSADLEEIKRQNARIADQNTAIAEQNQAILEKVQAILDGPTSVALSLQVDVWAIEETRMAEEKKLGKFKLSLIDNGKGIAGTVSGGNDAAGLPGTLPAGTLAISFDQDGVFAPAVVDGLNFTSALASPPKLATNVVVTATYTPADGSAAITGVNDPSDPVNVVAGQSGDLVVAVGAAS